MPIKPTKKEEEYFARTESDRVKEADRERQAIIEEEERLKLKELHYMQCPKCGMKLVEIDYKKIKIDKCTTCAGVWLDAGELEMVVQLDSPAIDSLFEAVRKYIM
ncbi:MAG: zf-TFIIB domain-containing protein [Deltaproteobacteria bacterium]|nr:zf-TFIIB domain-containing protein [Deltaproteobacteria bacterium]